MSKRSFNQVLSLIVFLFVVHSIGFAQQDPEDPGLPDSVLFEGVDYYVSGPPYEGELTVPLVFFNDEDLTEITVPLVWSGPVSFDSVSFAGSRVEKISRTPTQGMIYYKTSDVSNDSGKILLGVVVYMKDPVPARRGVLSTLYFTISDTGYFDMDTTFFSPDHGLGFSGIPPVAFVPVFDKLEVHLLANGAGDTNGDGSIDVKDIVFLISFLFARGLSPSNPDYADVNGDCEISLIDVVYLINYVLKMGPFPKPGCA